MLENIATETSQVSRPGRSVVAKVAIGIGLAAIVAGLLIMVWPTAPSDCHGSPVCALDGLAAVGKLFAGMLVAGAGIAWTCIAAAASAVRQGQSTSHH